ncbi:MAG: coactosin family protein [Chloroflexota bacterium]
MVDVSDPSLLAAYEDVRSDKTETDWAVFGYNSSGNKIQVDATGSGGIRELVSNLRDDAVQYGYVAVTTGDSESVRKKFIFITWGGPSSSVMRKARISVHKADLKEITKDFSAEVQATERSDLDEDTLIKTLLKTGTSDYSSRRY